MKIEEAINQIKGFRTLKERMLVNIHFTATYLANQRAVVLKELGLSYQQYNVLRVLKEKYPEAVTIKYLITCMMDKNSNASRLVDKLVLKNLVLREANEQDRRQMDVKLSDTGLGLLNEATPLVDALSDQVVFSDEEANQLSDLLDKLRKAAH